MSDTLIEKIRKPASDTGGVFTILMISEHDRTGGIFYSETRPETATAVHWSV